MITLSKAVVKLSGLLVVVITVSPYMIIPALTFAVILIKMRKFYVKPSQEMRRFEALSINQT